MNTQDFISRLRAAVNDFVEADEAYSDDVQLQINTLTWDVEIADPENDLPDCDYYPVMDLVRMSVSEPGKWEVDPEALQEVAADYVFTD